MALGDEIVNALNLHRTVDTLGRWKAHHLAELALAVRDATETEKAAAEAKLASMLQSFGHRAQEHFRYSEGYDMKKIAPILDKVLNK